MRGISSMATRQVLAELADAAVAAGFPRVEIESVGGVTAANRVAEGEAFDLVLLASGALAKLAAAGHVLADSVVPLVLSQVAVAVPSGSDATAEKPVGAAFEDAAGVRAALRAARAIGYSTGPSGDALVRMIAEWGLTEEVGDRLVQARAGVPVAKLLADGEVDLGFQQLSELVGQEGVRILGVMPDDCAIDTVFSGAVAAASQDAVAAEVLAFFASDAAAPIKQAHNFTLPQH
ncbi:ABC transporter substrate-binding protein [Gulosibacter macacae]|uniref:ABC transporter substrate-binding protein n=2 Tax=Gulosibacter macacae TaxID=2488791 RepID=A0A3P3VUV1_9MICO|nr:ABC transporter substrate-binding protein [Gulosibacter macacae]